MDSFSAMLAAHEGEDGRALSDGAVLEAVCREFANADEIIAEVRAEGITAADFFAGRKSLRVLPVRTGHSFNIKKHTSVQRPYRHSHDFYEFICVFSGRCAQVVDGVRMTVREGQCCLIAPGRIHELARSTEEDVILKLDLPAVMFEGAGGGLLEGRDLFDMSGDVKICVLRLLEESFGTDGCTAAATEALLKLFVIGLARGAHVSAGLLAEVENYVCSDFSTATLQGFAAVYGYAPAYASRLIGAETGRSFSQIARSCRLKEARRLLAAGVSAEETASRVGYGSLSGFYRQFCAAYGMTPAGYAQLFR